MTGEKETAKRYRRWPKVLLVVSLTLNLLFVGLIAGTVWREGGHRGHDRADRLMPLVMALPRSDRRALRTEFEQQITKHRTNTAGPSHDRLEHLLIVLRSRPFDADALRQHFTERVTWHEQRVRVGRDALVLRIIGLSDEERAKYADRLESRATHRRRH